MRKWIVAITLGAAIAAALAGQYIAVGGPVFNAGPVGPNGFSGSKTITFDHTKVGTVNNTDQTNFPALISGTYAYLATVANSGLVTSASGFDIVYTSDSGCTTPLNQELVNYTAATGAIEEWVKIPTLSHTTDTVIYECYGKSSITTDQSSTSTWSNSFGAVYHFGTASAIVDTDSSGNSMTMSNFGTVAAGAGQIVGGVVGAADPSRMSFNCASVGCASLASANQSVSAWIKTSASGAIRLIVNRDNVGSTRDFHFRTTAGNQLEFLPFINGTPTSVVTSGTVNTGAWILAYGTFDGTTGKTYLNGTADGSVSASGSMNLGSGGTLDIMSFGASGFQWVGSVDEVRVSSVARSADWIKTEYNNQNSPSTFYAVT